MTTGWRKWNPNSVEENRPWVRILNCLNFMLMCKHYQSGNSWLRGFKSLIFISGNGLLSFRITKLCIHKFYHTRSWGIYRQDGEKTSDMSAFGADGRTLNFGLWFHWCQYCCRIQAVGEFNFSVFDYAEDKDWDTNSRFKHDVRPYDDFEHSEESGCIWRLREYNTIWGF